MPSEIQYGQFVRESTLKQRSVSYNDLIPKLEVDGQGQPIPYHPPKLKLQSADIYNLLAPYFNVRLIEQVKAVFPLAIYLVLFQILILRQPIQEAVLITGGLGAVILGLMVFMEGLKLGLMPFGEVIGTNLPKKSPLPVVLLIAFLLGIGVTFAEPAIGALQAVGSIVNVEKAPFLSTLLGEWSGTLVLMVGMGVGLAAVLGTARFLYNWSLKPMIYMALIPTIGLTVYCMSRSRSSQNPWSCLGLWSGYDRSSNSSSCTCTRNRHCCLGRQGRIIAFRIWDCHPCIPISLLLPCCVLQSTFLQ